MQNGIVHRDLKLENILLDTNGNIKVRGWQSPATLEVSPSRGVKGVLPSTGDDHSTPVPPEHLDLHSSQTAGIGLCCVCPGDGEPGGCLYLPLYLAAKRERLQRQSRCCLLQP